jgi:uncharacterized membrane protein YesL
MVPAVLHPEISNVAQLIADPLALGQKLFAIHNRVPPVFYVRFFLILSFSKDDFNENIFLSVTKIKGCDILAETIPRRYPAMFRKLLNPDNALMITMTQITDCIFLSLFWMLGCFPVVTAGASFAALYDSVYQGFRKGNKHPWQRFLSTFKENWSGCILPTVLFLAVTLVLVKGLIAVWNAAVYGQISWMLFSAGAFLGVLVLGILSVLFPMVSRFENPLPALLKNTLFLALANLPRTLALGMLNALSAFLCIRFLFPLFFLPALAALIGTLFLEPMFKPFMKS